MVDSAEHARVDAEFAQIAIPRAAAAFDGGTDGIRSTDHRKGATKETITNGLTEGHFLSHFAL
ncbi:hypothetical protein [Rhizobium sp. Root708]|uniref:hypothetical protein n=1 Tax=Rhizobium sp. Root708 TaxID=1736592 RepID=UPI00138F974D|nr:hypothetical protein [Rhizobium sp. Root708]